MIGGGDVGDGSVRKREKNAVSVTAVTRHQGRKKPVSMRFFRVTAKKLAVIFPRRGNPRIARVLYDRPGPCRRGRRTFCRYYPVMNLYSVCWVKQKVTTQARPNSKGSLSFSDPLLLLRFPEEDFFKKGLILQ